MEHDQELDARGLLCPLPILKTRFALEALAPGQVLRVLSTDAGSVPDMQAFARQTGVELLATSESEGEYRFLIRKP